MGSSGGGGSGNTVTQVQSIPPWQEAQIQSNQALANSVAAQPYPTYQGQIVAPLNAQQDTGLQNTSANAFNYQPYIGAASNTLNSVYGLQPQATNDQTGQIAGQVNNLTGMATGINPIASTTAGVNQNLNNVEQNNPANAQYMQSLMSPYVQQSLAPQILQANQNLAQQQIGINQQAAQAGAFGDARQGAANALQNYYGQQTLGGIEAQGYNTAYNQALNTATTEQQVQNQAAQTRLGLGGLGVSEQNALTGLAGQQINLGGLQQNQAKLAQGEQGVLGSVAAQQAALGTQAQNQALTAGQAQFNVGAIQQQNTQQADTAAYQAYLNSVNWPFQMLNVRESSVNSVPYSMVSATTIPGQNSTQAGLAAFTSAAGALGSLGAGTTK